MKRFVLLITLIILTPYFSGCFGGDVEESSPELIENNLEPTNLAPVLMIWDQTIPYGSKSLLTGTLWDEFIDQTTIELTVQEIYNDSNIYSFTIEPNDEVWEIDLNLSDPGEYLVSAIITDLDGKIGNEKEIIYKIEYPQEQEARLLVAFEENENSTMGGIIFGSINHVYVESCSISYFPSIGGVINGLVDSENYTFSILVSSQINKTGNIIAICGNLDINYS